MASPTPTPLRGSYRQVLRNRQFLSLVVAHTVSMLGTSIAIVALAVLVFQRTSSPLLSALTFTLGFTPYLLGGVLSPRLEHVPARRLMICCDLFQGAGYGVMALPGLPVAAVLGVLALGSVAAPIFAGTRAALLPELLGEGDGFVLGRSVLRVISQTSQILGLALASGLLLLIPARDVLILVAATSACSALLIRLGIKAHRPAHPAGGPVAGSRGLRAVFNGSRRRLLVLEWVIPMAAIAPEALAVPYVRKLGLPAASAGLLLWAAPAGAVLGELLTVRLLGPAGRARAVLPLAAATLLMPIGFIVQPSLLVAGALLLLSAAGSGYTLGLDQLLLAATPPALRRRVLSVSTSGLMFWQGVGFAVAGGAAELVPIRIAIPAISVIGLIALASLAAGLGRRPAPPPSPETPQLEPMPGGAGR
jgi:hypothetical protein